MAETLLLDLFAWDLVLDSAGDIAVAAPPYAIAQDAASAIRTFMGEVFYDSTLGIPYFGDILGKLPPVSLIKSSFNQAALSVPGVVSAQTFLSALTNRVLSGQVQITVTPESEGRLPSGFLIPPRSPFSLDFFFSGNSQYITIIGGGR